MEPCCNEKQELLQICASEILAVAIPVMLVLAVSMAVNLVLWNRLVKMQAVITDSSTELIPKLSQDLHLAQYVAGRLYSYKVGSERWRGSDYD